MVMLQYSEQEVERKRRHLTLMTRHCPNAAIDAQNFKARCDSLIEKRNEKEIRGDKLVEKKEDSLRSGNYM